VADRVRHCSRLLREHQAPAPPEMIAGTLAYMAPEQTGRMNRSVDSRSDLYALGVSYYQMLTGQLPFTAADPMEWVHCHIARQPVPPHERVAGVPIALSAIVMKLLAKTAEERYQTAASVEADLRRCLAAWESQGQIEPFAPGAHDASDRLRIPEKLYGREREIEALLAPFDRVVATGTLELVLVSGYAGIGKSSVNELHKALVPPRGLFASGKFDQYKRDIPYASSPVEQLDVGTVLKAAQAVSDEIVLDELIKTLLRIAVEHAGAERGLLILFPGDEPQIAAEATTGRGQVEVTLRQATTSPTELPESVLHYVIRTRESVILEDALAQNPFSADKYICQKHARSVLCLPLVQQVQLIGVLYLENNLASNVFTAARISVLELLASQADLRGSSRSTITPTDKKAVNVARNVPAALRNSAVSIFPPEPPGSPFGS
jgi:AAA ATPase-like protein/GAF domain-containing protein/protein kinase-like protein